VIGALADSVEEAIEVGSPCSSNLLAGSGKMSGLRRSRGMGAPLRGARSVALLPGVVE